MLPPIASICSLKTSATRGPDHHSCGSVPIPRTSASREK
jgi:hypothetical protein